jgi:predicted dehydrogenase
MKTRRSFLKAGAVTGLGLPAFVPGKIFAEPPSGKLNHAAIGCSNQGWSDLQVLASSGKIEVVALCDVDTSVAAEAKQRFPQSRFYQDWRQLLEDEASRIDSVNIAVPDHMHASIALAALRKNKHVYCQKPLTHTISEARKLSESSVARGGLVTQMGNQIQSEFEYRAAVVLVQQGVIGKVKEVHTWCGSNFPQKGRPKGEDSVPDGLDWEKWIGTAPLRPFKKDIYHRFYWRGWQDFGGGTIADFCCHILDTPFKALELKAPLSIQAEVPKEWAETEAYNKENWPLWAIYRYEFAPTPWTTGPLPVAWYDGGKQPEPSLFQGTKIPGSGALFVGESGSLLLPHWATPQVIGKRVPLPKLERRNHYHHFVESALSQGSVMTTSPFSYGALVTETGLLGNIAARFPGRKLDWNSSELRFPNEPAADRFVRPQYRDGWRVEGLG